MAIRVRFDEVSPDGDCYEVQDVEGLSLHQDFVVKGPLTADCTLKRKGDTKVEMQSSLKAQLSLICDRCLVSYDVDVDNKIQILFETVPSNFREMKEPECNIKDLDYIVLDEPVIDIDDILRQQVYLSLPLKRICSEQCKGLCRQCGGNLNVENCKCSHEGEGSPFRVLARLNNNNTIVK